jgi:hypothetical protein
MTEQYTFVTAVWLQRFGACLAARVRQQPQMIFGYALFAEALIVPRYVERFVFMSTLGTVPEDWLHRFWNIFAAIVVVALLLFLVHPFQRHRVVAPSEIELISFKRFLEI